MIDENELDTMVKDFNSTDKIPTKDYMIPLTEPQYYDLYNALTRTEVLLGNIKYPCMSALMKEQLDMLDKIPWQEVN